MLMNAIHDDEQAKNTQHATQNGQAVRDVFAHGFLNINKSGTHFILIIDVINSTGDDGEK